MRRRDPAAQVQATDTATSSARRYWMARTRRLIDEIRARRSGDVPSPIAKKRGTTA